MASKCGYDKKVKWNVNDINYYTNLDKTCPKSTYIPSNKHRSNY